MEEFACTIREGSVPPSQAGRTGQTAQTAQAAPTVQVKTHRQAVKARLAVNQFIKKY